jgi:hypothetical protein
MEFQISSSGTKPNGMLVNNDGRALVESVSLSNITNASRKGQAFLLTSDFKDITTTGQEHGFFFIKNTSTDKMLMIDRIRTCGTGTQKWKLYKNPTAGTIINALGSPTASEVAFSNTNFASGVVASGNAYVGGEGHSISGGTFIGQWINGTGHSLESYQGAIQLGTNDSVALTVEVPSAITVCTNWLIYFKSPEDGY